MEQVSLNYDPVKDIAEVDQFGFVNITNAFKNGYVPGSNASVHVDFDHAEDPSAIVGKPSDVFEAYRMQDSLMQGIKDSGSKSKGSSSLKDER